MKPKDLKSPFKWEHRQIVIQDRVWYVPDQHLSDIPFIFPGWTHKQTFSQDKPIYLEYCSGNGAWIASKAIEQSQYNWVGIEKKFDRTRKIWSKIKKFELDNLLTICGEGFHVTRDFFANESVDAVFINFPDPWPKKRHAKHRIVQPAFVKEIHRILKNDKLFTLVTDDAAYSKIMIDVIYQTGGFISLFEAPYYTTSYPGYGSSYFEELWREKGKSIHYHVFRKI
ncbi:tRNA (guanine(46)-N(7))-methyltransferase TrmB [Candidatus Protochlamydia amoebophila]|nr:tRNA (guanine(46)-N(7))-methyltransferase TrmB [Candidatus Protochlamydia amoebophila]